MQFSRTVLLVEDDPDLRSALELILARNGYHVLATDNGIRAVQLAEEHHVDVALVDLLIPGQSGFQVLDDLKTRHGDRIRVFMMSGSVSRAHLDYAFATGAEQFLLKPFLSAELLEAIAEVCPPAAEVAEPRRTVRIGS